MITKDLNKLVDKVLKREEKIESAIKKEKEKKESLQTEIKELTKGIVNADISDDFSKKSELEKQLKQKRLDMADIDSMIEAYSNELNNRELSEKELDKIKDSAKKVVEERTQKVSSLSNEIDDLGLEIKKLEQEKEDKERQRSNLTSSYSRTEVAQIKKIIKYIEPRKFKYQGEENYISNWIDGETGELLDQYIEKPVYTEDKTVHRFKSNS